MNYGLGVILRCLLGTGGGVGASWATSARLKVILEILEFIDI